MPRDALVQARLRLQRFKCPSPQAASSQTVADPVSDQDQDRESSSICQDSTQTRLKLQVVKQPKRPRLKSPVAQDTRDTEDTGERDTWAHADIRTRPRPTAHSSVNPHVLPVPAISNGSTILPLFPALPRVAPVASTSKDIPTNHYVPQRASSMRITDSAKLRPTLYRLAELMSQLRKPIEHPRQRLLTFYASIAAVSVANKQITFSDIYAPGRSPFLTCGFFLVETCHASFIETSRVAKVTAVLPPEGGAPQVKRVVEVDWDEIHFVAGLMYAQR